jgi:predicted Zn-dependent protease
MTISFVTRLVLLVCVAALPACGTWNKRPLTTVRSDAKSAFSYGEFAKAEPDFQQVVDRVPEDNEARVLLGRSQLAQGKAALAAKNFGVALDVEPLRDDILDYRAQALFEANQHDDLTAFLNRACSERGRVKDSIRLAKYTTMMGHPDEAQQALATAARLDGGKSSDVQLAYARFYHAFGDKPRAVKRLRMAYFLAPENAEVLQTIRDMGEIPGPSFALAPTEMDVTPVRPQAAVGEK